MCLLFRFALVLMTSFVDSLHDLFGLLPDHTVSTFPQLDDVYVPSKIEDIFHRFVSRLLLAGPALAAAYSTLSDKITNWFLCQCTSFEG